ncbi:hypothetical protein BH23PLA1_BH23PLA1_25950 [soil metagenome]
MSTTQDHDIRIGSALSSGRYIVQSKLGEGGMGYVYRARDNNLGADVVIKVPRRGMLDDPEFVERFQLEIRSLVKLVHPHIVRITDVGRHGEFPYAVMHYLEGGSLDDRRDFNSEGRPLPQPPASIRNWLEPVARALDFVHGRGYVHRDVKPANILFDEQGHAFLGDFGVIKVVTGANVKARSGMTGTGMVLGTPEYMSPEIILGRPYDGRSDQYALAVTVFEMLAGRRPFESEAATEILVKHTIEPPPLLHDLCDRVRPATSEVVRRALAKEPSDRFPDCLAFASAVLDSIGARSPASSPPTTIPMAPPKVVKFACPFCGAGLKIPGPVASRKVSCPRCERRSRISRDLDALEPIEQEFASGGTMQLRPESLSTVKERIAIDDPPSRRPESVKTEPQVSISQKRTEPFALTLGPGKPKSLVIGCGVLVVPALLLAASIPFFMMGSGIEDSSELVATNPDPVPSALIPKEADAQGDRERLAEEARLAEQRSQQELEAKREQAALLAEQYLANARSAIEQKDRVQANQLVRAGLSAAMEAGDSQRQRQAQDWLRQLALIDPARIQESLNRLSEAELIAIHNDGLVLAPAEIEDEGIKLLYEDQFRPLLDAAIRRLPPLALSVADLIDDPGRYVGRTIVPTGYFEVFNTIHQRSDGHYATRLTSRPGTRSLSNGAADEAGELTFVIDRAIGNHLKQILEQNRADRRESIRCIPRLQIEEAPGGFVARITELTIALIPDLFSLYQFDPLGRAILVDKLGAIQLTSMGLTEVPLTPQQWEERIGPEDSKSIRGRKEGNLRQMIAKANMGKTQAQITSTAQQMATQSNNARQQQVEQMRKLLIRSP